MEVAQKASGMATGSDRLLRASDAEEGLVGGQNEEKEELIPGSIVGPVPGLGPRLSPEPFARERGVDEGGHEVDTGGCYGVGAGTEAGASVGEAKDAVDGKGPLLLASPERIALSTTDLEGRCADLSHGESDADLYYLS